MIETCKILHGIYDSAVSPDLPACQYSVTRGNNYKLAKNFSRYDIRQHFFMQKVINIWNCLPSRVVNSSSVNNFKNNLDKFCSKQEVYILINSDTLLFPVPVTSHLKL